MSTQQLIQKSSWKNVELNFNPAPNPKPILKFWPNLDSNPDKSQNVNIAELFHLETLDMYMLSVLRIARMLENNRNAKKS
jgi:hypothetical protein